MKAFWLAVAQLADAMAMMTGRVVLLGAGAFTLCYLIFCAVVATEDYRTGRAIRKGKR